MTTETGAGQWGTALAFACTQFAMECMVYMVRASIQQKPHRRVIMEAWGSCVVPSPVDDPDHPGSLGAGERLPDVVIAPCCGGSDLDGITFFVPEARVRLLAVEPLSCLTLTQGRFDYDFGDTAGLTLLLPMYTLGYDFVPPSIHAGDYAIAALPRR